MNYNAFGSYAGGGVSSLSSLDSVDQNPSLAFCSCARRAISPAIFITHACSRIPPTAEDVSERTGAGV